MRRPILKWRIFSSFTSFFITIEAGYDAKGNRIRRQRTVKAKNKTEAKKHLSQFQVEVKTGEYISREKMKFKDFVDEWRDKYASNPQKLSPSTLDVYENHLRNHIMPEVGHRRMDEIKTIMIVNFLKKLEQPGARKDGGTLSSGTIEVIYRTLRKVSSISLFKNLRHSCATLLLEEDVPMKKIQERLRHSRYETTANIYTHVTKRGKSETASKFDKFALSSTQTSNTR